MVEVWLRANARVWWLAVVVQGGLVLTGAALLVAAWPRLWLALPAVLLIVFAAAGLLGSIWQLRRPRLAYESGHLLAYLGPRRPFRVPIELVECFLLGQGPTLLPGKRHHGTETTVITLRISERAEQWSRRDIYRLYGTWCGGYVTLRGTFCEPLGLDLVQRLNARLAQVQAARERDSVTT